MVVKRVEGVKDASFSYQRGEGFVTYDTTLTSPQDFIAALERMTDYRAKLRPEPTAVTGPEAAAGATPQKGAEGAPTGEHP